MSILGHGCRSVQMVRMAAMQLLPFVPLLVTHGMYQSDRNMSLIVTDAHVFHRLDSTSNVLAE